eukprot:CAMPEP_0117568326 /NCGR_PEP_ID=MMETSP0784-20121206/58075_1 /TAXON_ID=39447 /ORGANISM="" /LENGTH=186 /DNA_ID=CAMNT_0005366245 /DNA_START=71 /DNA_END=631 /DNA_ORIENTATION=-
MSAELVESMAAISLESAESCEARSSKPIVVRFKVSGAATAFDVELEPDTAIRDVKKIVAEQCDIDPEHMRLVQDGKLMKEADTLECGEAPVQVLFTAGHTALAGGGSNMRSGGSTGQPGQLLRGQSQQQQNPFSTPVRGVPGAKGLRGSRVSGRRGGMAIIRKYGILMKRQEFREKAEEIGFVKYR